MRYFFTMIITALLSHNLMSVSAHAELKPSERFITDVTSQALEILKSAETPQQLETEFGILLDTRTNMTRIAKFTLGHAARSVDKADLVRFTKALRDTMVKIYGNRLAGFTNEKVIVTGSQTKGRNHLVNSRVEFANSRPPVDMVWWVIEEKDGSYTLFDIQVLGVWMAQEQRDIFSGILKTNNNNMEALIEHLTNQMKTAASDS